MPNAKSKNRLGLGNALMNDRFGKGKGLDNRKSSALVRTHHATGEQYLVVDKEEAAWVKMRSITEQGALDEFLATAELAGTDFTAEKMNNVKIIHTQTKNPYLLTADEENSLLQKHKDFQGSLTIPRRPKWDENTTATALDKAERASFLQWRRSLAEVVESNDLLMTPFERNIEVWRQLWRVIERSDVIIQIVDARNPLLFRSEDLEAYVKEIDARKSNLLLINKADMMTDSQRTAWATYLTEKGVAYKFFSAHLAKEANEMREEEEKANDSSDEESVEDSEAEESEEDEKESQDEEAAPINPPAEVPATEPHKVPATQPPKIPVEKASESTSGPDIKILTCDELQEMLLSFSPIDPDQTKLQVGLVGYPNVGKSSTINALIGAIKVSVSATPGKTKHFQTIHLSDKVVLCDCPGLVMPNFATTKGDLVCNGVLPIDQLREFTGPATLVAQRIPKVFLEGVYGINIKVRSGEEGGDGVPTASELLSAYAQARGFQTQGLGQPDESRAARYVLKDYVSGKLLYVAPPPGINDAAQFNAELYDLAHLPQRRRAALLASMQDLSLDTPVSQTIGTSSKSKSIDKKFFRAESRDAGHIKAPFNAQYSQQGSNLTGRKARAAVALENGLDPNDAAAMTSKKHFKGNPRGGRGKNREKRAWNDDE